MLCATLLDEKLREGLAVGRSRWRRVFTRVVPGGLQWSAPVLGWSIGVPAQRLTLRHGQHVLVLVAVENVSDHSLNGAFSMCFWPLVRNSHGRDLPMPVVGCSEGPPTGRFKPADAYVTHVDPFEFAACPAPGNYEVTIRSGISATLSGSFPVRVFR